MPTRGGPFPDAALLVIAVLLAAGFFLSFWGRNAEALGGRDMGIALALSFAVPILLFASLGSAAVAALAVLAAALGRRPLRPRLAALGVSLLPAVFLLFVDLL
ncbi:MAG TPA: hypothetical protein VLI67_02895 [Vicinamibacteria bacterium]|nr:hypothetical protein [Vicinamibacteria bacterium]